VTLSPDLQEKVDAVRKALMTLFHDSITVERDDDRAYTRASQHSSSCRKCVGDVALLALVERLERVERERDYIRNAHDTWKSVAERMERALELSNKRGDAAANRITELEQERDEAWQMIGNESAIQDFFALKARVRKLEETFKSARAIVDEQAEDEGLWFIAESIIEAYFQQELRRLHIVIEAVPFAEHLQTAQED